MKAISRALVLGPVLILAAGSSLFLLTAQRAFGQAAAPTVQTTVENSGQAQAATEIGGQRVVVIRRQPVSTSKPEFTSVTVLPGRGMEVLQITANFPGRGNVNVLASQDLLTAKKQLDEDESMTGAQGYMMGAAFLVPYPNRIRGTLSADGKTLTTEWMGRRLILPANNIGKLPTAERHAMHGLILRAKAENVRVKNILDGQQMTATIHAGDFGGNWPSKSDLLFTIRLTGNTLDVRIRANNVGTESEPMAIAWHPYFNLPSGDRTQARLHLPGSSVAEVDNYDNVFPTGKLLPVTGTKFDLQSADGLFLGDTFFDDNWTHLDRSNGAITVRVVDPVAHYGVAIEGLSPEIHAIQVYAPPAKSFVAIEHQYNFGDPFGKEWGATDTGMVTLKPGKSTEWHVRLRLFVPEQKLRP